MSSLRSKPRLGLTEGLALVASFIEAAGLGSPEYLITADSLAGPGSVAGIVRNRDGVCSFWLIRVVGSECKVGRGLTPTHDPALADHGEGEPEGLGESRWP